MKSILRSLPRSPAEAMSEVRRLSASPAVQAAFWVILGSGGYQLIRLIGNIFQTHLLFPELFGIMALVNAVLIGLGQLSDVGLREGVINSSRTNEPKFMQTAWTLQVLRTVIMAVLAAAIALPVSQFYDEALLFPVLVIISLCSLLAGFKSIALLAYDKRLDVKTQVLVELCTQIAGITVAVTWAWISPTIWALVAGHVFSSVLELILSYVLFKGHNSKFAWDKESVNQLFGFGKWIFISSTISWIVFQGDRIFLGKYISMTELGKYSIAANWAAIVMVVSANFSTRVLHPYFVQAVQNHSDFSKIHKVRNLLNIAYTFVCIFMAFIGDWLVRLIYNDNYANAGWMLQILALGQVGRSLTGTVSPFMLACGDSFSQMKFSAASALILVGFIVIGGWAADTHGLIVAIALAGIAAHPVMVLFAARHGYHCALVDLSLLSVAIATCLVGWWLTDAPIFPIITELFFKFVDFVSTL